MRSFGSILLLFAVSLLAAAALAYPAWVLIGLLDDQPIHRILHRLAMLAAIVGMVWLVRRWRLTDKQSAGFGLPRRTFWKQIGTGLLLGAVIIAPLLLSLHWLDVRTADPTADVTAGRMAKVLLKGLLTGLVVSFIEELFFRGYLFTAIERESGRLLAIVLPSLLYASVHFLDGRLRVPRDEIEWDSGFTVLSRMFLAYNDPLRILDSFLALFAVGVLLAIARARSGAIALCIGMHAAWVCLLYLDETITQFNPDSNARWLVGSYDNVIGWGTVAWMGVMAGAYWLAARNAGSVAVGLRKSG
ncbi:MAG TPA: CPBP family intramembrane metalloprotease [Povalibacter sp.]|uniref:CPBP family intramembrane glutamic endopeptidase n=1 Tax=Povalibacter sp. TaxID=1962978 RepID=UPI002B733BF0|nr:CPBP family intramembrane glutamic endopeptidase [Povalibacter sp.]HMN45313.1 CPBP family intramembrane metalloprotease [Povalibacter sp.]